MTEEGREIRLKEDVLFRNIDGEGIVLRQTAGEVLVVNRVAVRVLELIEGGNNLKDVLATLEQEFEVEPAQLRNDVQVYLAELDEAGVLEPDR